MTRLTQLVGLLAFSSSLLSPLVAAQVDVSLVLDTTNLDSRQVDGPQPLNDVAIDTRQVDGPHRHSSGNAKIDTRQKDGPRPLSESVVDARQADNFHFAEREKVNSRQVDGPLPLNEVGIDSRQVDGQRKKVDIDNRQVDGQRVKVDINSRQVDGQRKKVDINSRQVDGQRVKVDIGSRQVDGNKIVEVPKDFPLQIMPLGDSITLGVGSEDQNGYRKTVHNLLATDGWEIKMVGSKKDGNMTKSNHEGWPGYTIDEVHGKFTQAKAPKPNLVLPNVVLLNAGTNDCGRNVDIAQAVQRLASLIDDIYVSISGVTVVVSTLAPSPKHADCAAKVSQQYRDLVQRYQDHKSKMALADVQRELDVQYFNPDGVHPSDEGYEIMGRIFYNAVKRVQGQIQKPIESR